jgi:hypothetical protein
MHAANPPAAVIAPPWMLQASSPPSLRTCLALTVVSLSAPSGAATSHPTPAMPDRHQRERTWERESSVESMDSKFWNFGNFLKIKRKNNEFWWKRI